ncbi:TolC family protein [Treponema brennaborense]|uniref:Outer membrane efflux protein n=1 Tax=Treponema brennaborense (strain DSM 12168 / CIP 105900 / DD5/3) TaxID=906968 RepID=F4LLX4_TREBD|nr:TolC family protein [Treponema brennaborense]AEE15666.1 outer membrane efflux protein [Treponema brennaborense DSM 12168]
MNKWCGKRFLQCACRLLLAVLPLASGFAQTDGQPLVLTIDEAVKYANGNSKTLKSSAIDLEVKKRASDMVWNQFLPSVSVSATASRSNEYSDTMGAILSAIPGFPYQPSAVTEADHWTAVGNVGISWNFSFALVDGIRIIRQNYEAGLVSWDQTLRQNELQIRKLFYGLLLQQESFKIQQQSLLNAQKRVDQAKVNYRNGLIPELALLQTQVAYENQKPAVLKMEQAVNQQLDLFAFMLGLPAGTKITLDGKIDPVFITLDAETLIDQYAWNNPDIVSLQKNLEILRLNLSVQNLQAFTPALSLSWGWQPMVSDIDSNWINTYTDRGAFSATLAWNLTNLLPFSANRQQAKDTKANISKLELSLETLLQKAELDIRTQVDTLAQSHAAIEASAGNIALAQKSYDMTLAAYRNGTKELLDVRDAENQLNQAKLGLANEKYNYLSGLLDLEYSLNTKFVK